MRVDGEKEERKREREEKKEMRKEQKVRKKKRETRRSDRAVIGRPLQGKEVWRARAVIG